MIRFELPYMKNFSSLVSLLLLLLFCCPTLTSWSQRSFRSINADEVPYPSDKIDRFPNYIDPTELFENSGFYKSEKVADFTLYSSDGKRVNLSEQLADGKAVVLVSGSFSCHAFRYRMPEVNYLVDRYKDSIKVFVVLCAEAHPSEEVSPYFGYINNPVHNIRDKVSVHQTFTYQDRLWLADSVKSRLRPKVPLLIDDKHNSYLSHFGPAPNNAYLIGPKGTVIEKQGWFNGGPEEISSAIDSLLGRQRHKITTEGKLRFDESFQSRNKGIAGLMMQSNIRIDNPTDKGVEVGIRRLNSDLPEGWSSSFCTTMCHDTGTSYVSYFLKPMQSAYIAVDLRTKPLMEDSGKLKIQIVNLNDSSNVFNTDLSFYTYKDPSDIMKSAGPELYMYPSPTKALVFMECSELKSYSLTIYSRTGKSLFTFTKGRIPEIINLAFLEPGLYTMVFEKDGTKISRKYLRP